MIEDGAGAVVGEVHQRWHLWRRKYDLYLGKRQFAAIDGGFLAWDFTLRDESGGVYELPVVEQEHGRLVHALRAVATCRVGLQCHPAGWHPRSLLIHRHFGADRPQLPGLW